VRHTPKNEIPPAAVRRAGLKRQHLASGVSNLPSPLPLPTGGKQQLKAGQLGTRTGFQFPAQPVSYIDFERVLSLENKHPGARVLLVGAGPSSRNWEKYHKAGDIIIACNSAILMLADVADYFLCTEGNGYELPWFWTKTKAVPVVSYCNLKWPEKDKRILAYAADAIPIERSWHLAGFNPRSYFNPTQIAPEVWNDAERNLYSKYRTFIGVDRYSAREWGLLKGPVCYGQMSVGTVCVNGAHMAAYMGAGSIASIGFEFHMANGAHAAEPQFKYRPSKWSPPECFIMVNGKPTLWHFALSAAYAVKLRPVFKEAGVDWRDFSGGLQDIPGIESLMSEVHAKPHNVTIKVTAKRAALAEKAAAELHSEPSGATISPEVHDGEEVDQGRDQASRQSAQDAGSEEGPADPQEQAEGSGEEGRGDGTAGETGTDPEQDAPQVAEVADVQAQTDSTSQQAEQQPQSLPEVKARKKPGPKPGSHRKSKVQQPAADASEVAAKPQG
jgi:hypothetical protein